MIRIIGYIVLILTALSAFVLIVERSEEIKRQLESTKEANGRNLYRVVELQSVLSDLLSQPVHFGTRCNEIDVTATAYTASADETDDRPWETADGSLSTVGRIAVSRDLEIGYGLSPGTTVALAGMGLVRIDDRMAARHGKSIDVMMASKEAARRFGKREMVVVWCK